MPLRIAFDDMKREFSRILKKLGFTDDRADLSARMFAETSRDGVYSHGVNRFPTYVDYIRRGIIRVDAKPDLVESFGSLERWDGNLGPGNLNAWSCMERSTGIAKSQGMGCVALRNTNHWLRGGSYGWQAADENCIAVCFTNAIPGMPPWGGKDNRVGNNPFVIAVPRKEGHIVLDMALSQFSYGRMEAHRMNGEPLPVPGGFDRSGGLTADPAEILDDGTVLPVGFWKGSGMAMMLDLMAAILSDGRTSARIGQEKDEFNVSQIFIAFSLERLQRNETAEQLVNEVVKFVHSAEPVKPDGSVYYPGERTLRTRHENMEKGIPVNEEVWERITKI